MVADYTATLAGMLVGTGSTLAIADSIALELVSALKAEWLDWTPADTENVEDIPFAHEATVDVRLGTLAHDRDLVCAGAGWPQCHQLWAFSMDFGKPAGLFSHYTLC